jgi:hypothetical protein
MGIIYQGDSTPVYTQSLPLCVSLVAASMTLMMPLTLSSTVMAAFS